MSAYHTMSDEIESLTRFAFRGNFLAKCFRSVFNTRCSWNSSYDYSFAPRLFERFFDSAPIMDGGKWWESKGIGPTNIYG